MSVDRTPDMRAMYGDRGVYLLGGSLLRHLDRICETIKEMRAHLT